MDIESLYPILAVAEGLKASIRENPDFAPLPAANQYRTLRQKLLSVDTKAKGHVPNLALHGSSYVVGSLRDEVTFAVNQMVAYLRARVGVRQNELRIGTLGGLLVSFLEMLQLHSLGTKWAVSAAMLSLIEVITNQKLAQMGLDTSGEFDKRVNRLNAALKPRGIEIPALLLTGLYKVRSKVIHEGKEPTEEENTKIYEILNSFHEKTR